MAKTIRVAAIQTKRRTISYNIATTDEALKQVRDNTMANTGARSCHNR